MLLPAHLRAQRCWVTPEPLNVTPLLVGRPLATPARRALAMGADLLVVALLSGVSGFWLVGGLVLVVLQLRSQRSGGTPWRTVVGWLLAALLALLALQEAQTQWQLWDAGSMTPAARAASKASAAAAETGADDDDDDKPKAGAADAAPGLTDAQRIASLQAQLAEARRPRPISLRTELDRLIDAIGASFGWGIVYFSLLPAWWSGQTLGKKVFGLRVVELTGKPMTVLRCLKRYGGYAAGMATGGLGFVQLLWDVNRQAIQDRTAHTVVLDLRAPPRANPLAAADDGGSNRDLAGAVEPARGAGDAEIDPGPRL